MHMMPVAVIVMVLSLFAPSMEGAHAGGVDACPVAEVAVGKLKAGANVSRFLADSRALDGQIKKMKGFISRSFYEAPDTGQYMDIVCWRSVEDAKKAADEVHAIPACNAYLSHYREEPDLFIHGVRRK